MKSCDTATPGRTPFMALNNSRGNIVNIAMIILALIGGWYVWQSAHQGQLVYNLKSIFNDFLSVIKR